MPAIMLSASPATIISQAVSRLGAGRASIGWSGSDGLRRLAEEVSQNFLYSARACLMMGFSNSGKIIRINILYSIIEEKW